MNGVAGRAVALLLMAGCSSVPVRAVPGRSSLDEMLTAGHPLEALVGYRALWAHDSSDGELASAAAVAAVKANLLDEAFVWLDRAVEGGVLGPTSALDHDFDGVRADPRFAALLTRAKAVAEPRARQFEVGSGLPRSTPEAENIDPTALAKLLAAAEASGSSAIVVVRNGRLVGDWYFGGSTYRVEAMSATKSVVELAIGLLIAEGRIASLDEPLWHFYPEWRQGLKEQVTLRMVLNHTSGLQAGRTTGEIYRSPDFVKLALAAELSSDPG